jgi:septum site-determining protein MinC
MVLKKSKSSKVKKYLGSGNAASNSEGSEVRETPEVPAEQVWPEIEPAVEPVKAQAGQAAPVRRTLVGENRTNKECGDDNTVLIKRTVRSGQCIQYAGNIVVLGDVNPGSELIASGNIVVMGALRGVVHAGATGDEEATVAAFRLQPTQLRIANHITRPPDGEYLPPNQPEVARIRDGVVVIEAYQINQDKQMKIC